MRTWISLLPPQSGHHEVQASSWREICVNPFLTQLLLLQKEEILGSRKTDLKSNEGASFWSRKRCAGSRIKLAEKWLQGGGRAWGLNRKRSRSGRVSCVFKVSILASQMWISMSWTHFACSACLLQVDLEITQRLCWRSTSLSHQVYSRRREP